MADDERRAEIEDRRGLMVPMPDALTGMWIVRAEWNPPTFRQFRTYAAARAWCDEVDSSDG